MSFFQPEEHDAGHEAVTLALEGECASTSNGHANDGPPGDIMQDHIEQDGITHAEVTLSWEMVQPVFWELPKIYKF